MKKLLLLLLAAPLAAQQPAPPPAPPAPPLPGPLEVGAVAPDFTLSAATNQGMSVGPFRLSDHRDKTVVIAFFFRARSSG